jgi:hypothetical protein
MSFKTLTEKIISDITPSGNRAVFIFGRMNPPTLGHEFLMAKAVEIARKENCECFIFVSKTFDKKKNPVPYDDKLKALDAALPRLTFVNSPEVITIFNAVKYLADRGYKDLTLVCGSDRVASYQTLFEPYKNHEDPEKRLGYNELNVVSAGERDPDSDEISGISGTKARELAIAGDFESFKRILPTGMPDSEARVLFDDIRQNSKPIKTRAS